jgi:hypothetical protein
MTGAQIETEQMLSVGAAGIKVVSALAACPRQSDVRLR